MDAVNPIVPEVGMLARLCRIEIRSSELFAKGLSGFVVIAIVLRAIFFATLAASIVARVDPDADTRYTLRFFTISGFSTMSIGWQHIALYLDTYLAIEDATYESPEPVITQSSIQVCCPGNSNFCKSSLWYSISVSIASIERMLPIELDRQIYCLSEFYLRYFPSYRHI